MEAGIQIVIANIIKIMGQSIFYLHATPPPLPPTPLPLWRQPLAQAMLENVFKGADKKWESAHCGGGTDHKMEVSQ